MQLKYLLFISLFIALVSFNAFAQLTGTKTIPGDYATIAAAITALNSAGVGSGGVTFNVAANYTETFASPTAGTITTTTSDVDKPIIFQKSGVGANPIITAATGTSTTTDGIIKIAGGDYITFDGIDLQENLSNTTNTTRMEWGYALVKRNSSAPFNGCQYVTIKNCTITLNKANTNSVGIYSGNHIATSTTALTIISTTDAMNNGKFFNNTLTNVYVGIRLAGYNAASPYTLYDQNNEIGVDGANSITNFGGGASAAYGVYLIYQNNPNVSNNTINNEAGGGTPHGAALYGIFYSTAGSGNIVGSNNTITLSNSSASSATHFINNEMDATTEVFNNNTFAAGTISSTGTVSLIYASNATPSKTVSGNQTSDTINRTGASGSFQCYFNNTASGTITENIFNNNFSNITIAGSTNFRGIYSNGAEGFTQNIYGNIISNITGGSGELSGIRNDVASTRYIYNNQIFNISGSGSSIYGIYSADAASNPNIYNNFIYNISSTNSNGTVSGIHINAGNGISLYKNSIYNISSSGTGTSVAVNGININDGTNVYIYNNFISHLSALASSNPNSIYGINIGVAFGASTSVGLYYNTIYLNAASSTLTNFGTTGIFHIYNISATNTTLDMRNNIVVNLSTPKGTGKTVAFRRSLSTDLNNYSASSNNNCFYAGTPASNRLIFYDGTNSDQTILAFQNRVTPRETYSFTENVNFIDVTLPLPYDLHINTATATYTESGGTPVTTPISITTDYDNNARNAFTPDVGADEFNGINPNLTPPVITYTPLGGGTVALTQVLANVSITDGEGVNTIPGTAPRVYYKKSTHANAWVDNTNSTNGWKWVETTDGVTPFDFTIDYSKLFGGGVSVGDVIQYFVVAQDLFIFPNVGINSGTFNQPASSVNLQANNFPIGGTINSFIIFNPISGIILVGATETYTSLTADSPQGLFKKLNESLISGNIIVKITSNIFESGAVALNQTNEEANFSITIEPGSDSQKIISGNYAGGLIRLNGADNITFDGRFGGSGRYLTFKNTSTSSSAVFHIISQGTNAGATDNTIRSCIIEAGSKTADTYGIFAGSSSLGSAGNDNDNLSIIDNIVSKANSGIYVFASASGVNDDLVITGNSVGSEISASYIGRYGIVVLYSSDASIAQNTIFNIISDTYNTFGIYSHYTTNSTISGNRISSIRYTGVTSRGGMGIDINTQSFTSNLTVANNIIYDISGKGFEGGDDAIQGIRIQNNQGGIKIYYNSINLYGQISQSGSTNDKSYSLYIGSGVTDLDVRNNILANSMENTTGTATAYAIYCESAASAFTNINYNDYYASGPEGVLGYLGSNRTTLAQWQTATGQDGSSIESNPLFNSNENLRPQTGSLVIGAGTPIGGITTDFLGVVRGIPPSIGAYELAGDFGAPIIQYTILNNTASTANRTLSNVTITDATGVNWTTNKPRIYYKKSTDNNVFVGNTSADNGWKWTEANTSSSPTNFTINYSIINGGLVNQGDIVQYFIVAQDVSVPPLVASNPSVGFAGSSVSIITSAPVSPNQYIIQSGPMSGDYTVGVSGTYSTLTLAVQDLNDRGVNGPARFLLIDGTYGSETFPIVIDIEQNLPTSANSITIKPDIGVTASISGSSSSQIIKILNSFVTIDGSNTSGGTSRDLTIESTTNFMTHVAILIGSKGSTPITNVEIKNARIISRYVVNTYFGPAAILMSDEDGLNYGLFNNITIRNNKIMRANYGIYCLAQEVTGNGSGLLITENDLDDAVNPIYHCGIFLESVDGATISKNTIANFEGSYDQNDKGIEISYYTRNSTIEANTIHTLTGPNNWGAHGISINTFTSNANILVKNNVIYNITGKGYQYSNINQNPHGIFLEFNQSGIKIYNNSIHLYGNTLNQTNAISTGIGLGPGSSAEIKNNIIVNNLGLQGVGYGSVGIFLQDGIGQLEASSNNLIFVNPSGSGVKNIGQINTTGYLTMQDWRTATNKDIYSFSGDPTFTSNTNLLPNSSMAACWAVNNKGLPLADVAADFNGNPRSTTVTGGPVDIGAYEFDATTDPPIAIQGGTLGNNQISTYSVFEFQSASIDWGSSGTPTGITFLYFTGIEPLAPNNPDQIKSKCFWDITQTGGSSFTYDITFKYDPAQIGVITSESDIRLAKSNDNGSNWIAFEEEGTLANQYILDTTANTIKVHGLISFSLFALTDKDDPLPVELNSFSAAPSGRDINLKWETETEVSSYGFEIERASSSTTPLQGLGWEKIGFVVGHGNSNSPKQYNFTDNNLNSGKYMYRLKMVDNDGSYEYSPEVESEIDVPKDYLLSQNYPNPFNPATKIDYQLPFESNVTIELYNITGERVDVLVNQEQAAGYYTVEVSSTQLSLSSGVYIYRMTALNTKDLKSYTQLKKMVVLK